MSPVEYFNDIVLDLNLKLDKGSIGNIDFLRLWTDAYFNARKMESDVVSPNNFEDACRPLMKYLSENHHPHIKVIIDGNSAEMLEGNKVFKSNEFIVD